MPIMNQEQIMEIIPHRDPFLLIETIEELEPGVCIVAAKNLKQDEYWFKGHYPSYPIQPGVLMIEMMAQAGAVCAMVVEENKGKIPVFAGIDKAKFRREVKPGDNLKIEVRIVKMRSGIGIGEGIVFANGERAVTATIKFAFASAGQDSGAVGAVGAVKEG